MSDLKLLHEYSSLRLILTKFIVPPILILEGKLEALKKHCFQHLKFSIFLSWMDMGLGRLWELVIEREA